MSKTFPDRDPVSLRVSLSKIGSERRVSETVQHTIIDWNDKMAKNAQPLEDGPKTTTSVLELVCSVREGCAGLACFGTDWQCAGTKLALSIP